MTTGTTSHDEQRSTGARMTTRITEGAEPKHQQLRRILLDLATTRLAPGAAIPSERQLIAEYGVSRITVREALGQLVNEGYLERVRGKGTFVAHRPVQSTLHLASFTEEMRAMGHVPTTVVLVREERVPPSDTAAALRLGEHDTAYHLKRLRMADGAPVSIDDAWLAADDVATLLGTRTGAPVLEFDRVSYSGDRPVEHARSWYRSDRYRVQMEVTASRSLA